MKARWILNSLLDRMQFVECGVYFYFCEVYRNVLRWILKSLTDSVDVSVCYEDKVKRNFLVDTKLHLLENDKTIKYTAKTIIDVDVLDHQVKTPIVFIPMQFSVCIDSKWQVTSRFLYYFRMLMILVSQQDFWMLSRLFSLLLVLSEICSVFECFSPLVVFDKYHQRTHIWLLAVQSWTVYVLFDTRLFYIQLHDTIFKH